MGFLRILLIFIVGFYAFRLLMRWISPWLMKKAAQKMQAQTQGQSRQGRSQDGREEGDIRVEYTNRSQNATNKSAGTEGGDYIEFEEITE